MPVKVGGFCECIRILCFIINAQLHVQALRRVGAVQEPVKRDMKPSTALEAHRVDIRRIVLSHRALNPRVFGSVLHGEDREGSDLDLIIDPTPETTLMDVAAISVELLELLGVPVDVVTPNALPEKFRAAVIAEAKPV